MNNELKIKMYSFTMDCIDPAGHPFFLCQMKPVFDSTRFALQ